jgi:hypothetical protein
MASAAPAAPTEPPAAVTQTVSTGAGVPGRRSRLGTDPYRHFPTARVTGRPPTTCRYPCQRVR